MGWNEGESGERKEGKKGIMTKRNLKSQRCEEEEGMEGGKKKDMTKSKLRRAKSRGEKQR